MEVQLNLLEASEPLSFGKVADLKEHYGSGIPPLHGLPFFVDLQCRALFENVCLATQEAIQRTMDLYFTDQGFFPDFEVPGSLMRHWLPDPKAFIESRVPSTFAVRLDIFWYPDSRELKLLEINGTDPSALAWTDRLAQAYSEYSGIKTLIEKGLVLPHASLTEEHASRLKKLIYLVQDHKSPLTVGFVMEPESTVAFDFQCYGEFYEAMGFKVVRGFPSQLEVNCGRFYLKGEPIDALVHDAFEDFLVSACLAKPEVLQCLKKNRPLSVNPVFSLVPEQKTILAEFIQPNLLEKLSPSSREIMGRIVPLSANLHGVLAGRSEFTLERVMHSRDALVLKPASGFGGDQVTLGRSVSQNDWEKALRAALLHPKHWLVQEYLPVPRSRFKVLSGRDYRDEDLFFNLSLWMIQGKYIGAFVRTSSSEVINVHRGGSLVPVFFHKKMGDT